MRELVSLASLFLFLAFAGIEPGHARTSKTCSAGMMAVLLSAAC